MTGMTGNAELGRIYKGPGSVYMICKQLGISVFNEGVTLKTCERTTYAEYLRKSKIVEDEKASQKTSWNARQSTL